MSRITVAIDLSITSPGIAIHGINNSILLITHSEHLKHHISKCNNVIDIRLLANTRTHTHTKETYFNRIKYNAEMVVGIINDMIKDEKDVHFYIEGYSFSARGMVFDIAELTGIVKYLLEQQYSTVVNIAEPSVIKKFATGKGNANKQQMRDAIKNVPDVFQLYQQITPIIQGRSKKDLTSESPLADLTDAYYLLQYALSRSTNQ